MSEWAHEWRLFADDGTVPEMATAAWYEHRERAPHLEQAGQPGWHHERLVAAAALVLELLEADRTLRSVGDFGAGDGGMLSILPDQRATGPGETQPIARWGYDLCPANVAAAVNERHVDVRLLDFTARNAKVRWPHLAVMTETLEHLADPHGWLRRLAGKSRALVCSSPAEERAGFHDPVHLWAWDMAGYFAMITNAGWTVTAHQRCGPYQVVKAVRT